MTDTTPNVAFIGLDDMGGSMATHLVESGVEVTVYDIDPDRVDRVVAAGATPANGSAGAVREADVTLLSLPGPEQIEEVFEVVESALDPGTMLVDTTTSTPLWVASCGTS